MATVDTNYCFIYADYGCQGRLSDGAVFRNTQLFTKMEGSKLNLPLDESFNGTNSRMPYVFIGDDAFPLSTCMLKPFPGLHTKGSKERIFNYCLSRARCVVENVFRVMSSVFRVL